jgi:hypothetical protein
MGRPYLLSRKRFRAIFYKIVTDRNISVNSTLNFFSNMNQILATMKELQVVELAIERNEECKEKEEYYNYLYYREGILQKRG